MKRFKTVECTAPMYGANIMADAIFYVSEQCVSCKHVNRLKWVFCKAFPNGIPQEILEGAFDHSKPWPDGHTPADNGIMFEKNPNLTTRQNRRKRNR